MRIVLSAAVGLAALVVVSIAFSARSEAGQLVEYSVGFDGTGRTQIGAPGPVLRPDPRGWYRNLVELTRSPDGSSFAFVDEWNGDYGLYAGSMSRQVTRLTPPGLVVASLGPATRPVAFSPDGAEVAFTVRVGRRLAIDVIGRDGSDLRQVAFPGHDPSWSADGRYLAYGAGGPTSIYVAKLNGRMRKIGRGNTAVFAPVGNSVAFVSPANNVVVVDRTGAGARQLGPARSPTRLVWSSDGKMLAWASPAGITVVTVGKAGAKLHRVVWNFASYYGPKAFSPDGRLLLTERFDGNVNSTSLVTVPVGGGDPVVVAPDASKVGGIQWASPTTLTYFALS
jgi:Tol biopolymer transport system component